MGKASSAKKVARAARAGGSRRAGQRRALGFPAAIGAVLVLGLLLVVFARERRDADAFPRANEDHVHSAVDVYTCVADSAGTDATTTTTTTTTTAPVESGDSTTTSTTTTAPVTSTTQAAPNDVPGEYQPGLNDAQDDVLGIHSHGDGLMHIHPFSSSAAGRKATLGVWLDQVGVSMTDGTLGLPGGGTFTEGTTKCEGGKDGVVQVARWERAADAAKGDKPNQIFTEDFDKIRLGENQVYTIAFMPEGSTIPAKSDVADRIAKVSDVAPSTTESTGSQAPATSSGAPNAGTESTTTSTSSSTTTSSSAPGP